MAEVVTFEPGTEASAHELAPLLRQQDVEEVMACSGHTGLEALLSSVRVSHHCVAMRFAGELGALFGLAELEDVEAPLVGMRPVGCLWFLTGQACERHKVSLVRAARRLVPLLHDVSGCLELRNWMDARYTGALILARLVGFRVLLTEPHGPAKLPFHLVSRRA